MTHSNNNDRTRIQSDRPTSIQNDHHQVYPTSGNQVSDRRRILNDREVELGNQDIVNPNPSIGNGNRTASPASYQNGYTQGRVVERQAYEENLRVRDDNSASRGLLLGILLTSLLGLTVGALYFVNQQSQTPVVPVPVEPQEETETNNTEVRERIIERTREIVPVPQPQAPAPQQPAAEPAPAVPPASTTQPEAVQPEIAQPEAAQPEAVQPDPAQPEVSEPAPPAANPVQ